MKLNKKINNLEKHFEFFVFTIVFAFLLNLKNYEVKCHIQNY